MSDLTDEEIEATRRFYGAYKNYIPRDKIQEILDKAEYKDDYFLPEIIEDLEKVLGIKDE